MAPKFKFADGEKVLCFHGPLLYEAKCIKAQVKDKIVKYYIHYSGWNKNWDEWVPESRVLKFNDANMQKQKELATQHGSAAKKTKTAKAGTKRDASDRESSVLPPQDKTPKQKTKEAAASSPAASGSETPADPQRKKRRVVEQNVETRESASVSEAPADPQRKKRRVVEQNVETEEEFSHKIEIKIKIPEELKHWLVDDWNAITKHNKLFKLPARQTVENILSDYSEHKHKISGKGVGRNKESAVLETTNGVREYFNIMLGKQLLYRLERAQYQELMAQYPDTPPSHLYGSFHLLRLFTKIGGALAYTPLDEDSSQLLTGNLFDFLKYMSKSSSSLFIMNDFIPAAEYKLEKKNSSDNRIKKEASTSGVRVKKETSTSGARAKDEPSTSGVRAKKETSTGGARAKDEPSTSGVRVKKETSNAGARVKDE